MRFETLQERCEWIKSKVSLKDVFDDYGVSYQNMDLPHQVRCPFHDDLHASARFFPQQNDGSGSFFCWACNMGGDVIWFVQEFNQLDNSVQSCRQIETDYGLQHTADDVVAAFYKASHLLKDVNDEDLVKEHIKLLEVKMAGATYKSDLELNGLFFEMRGKETDSVTLPTVIGFWMAFDSMSADSEGMTYQEVGKEFDKWRDEFTRWIQQEFEWQVVEDSDLKLEL